MLEVHDDSSSLTLESCPHLDTPCLFTCNQVQNWIWSLFMAFHRKKYNNKTMPATVCPDSIVSCILEPPSHNQTFWYSQNCNLLTASHSYSNFIRSNHTQASGLVPCRSMTPTTTNRSSSRTAPIKQLSSLEERQYSGGKFPSSSLKLWTNRLVIPSSSSLGVHPLRASFREKKTSIISHRGIGITSPTTPSLDNGRPIIPPASFVWRFQTKHDYIIIKHHSNGWPPNTLMLICPYLGMCILHDYWTLQPSLSILATIVKHY